MNVTAILNFLLIAGALQGFVFNIATFLIRKKIERPVLFLNLLVFFLSMNNLQSWLIDKGFVFDQFFLKHLLVPWYVLILPMFYAFLVYYLGIEKKRMPFLKLTIFIFIGELLARTIILCLVDIEVLSERLIPFYNSVEDAITLSYSIFIFIKAVQLIFRYPVLYPKILVFDDLRWVKRFLKWGSIIFVLWIIAVLLNMFSNSIKAPYSYYPLRIVSSVLIYWIGYQAFFRFVIMKDRIVLRRQIRTNEKVQVNNVLKIEKTESQEAQFNKIHRDIVLQQKYFDSNLSLETLSDELGISIAKLSKLVNQFSGDNFPDYINKLRVDAAKSLLVKDEFKSYTIAAIGLECGFNSKSTFYSAFKKFTSKTPTEYKKGS